MNDLHVVVVLHPVEPVSAISSYQHHVAVEVTE